MRNDGLDAANAPVKHTLTQAERQALVDRHVEAANLRQAEADLALIKAVELGAAFQRLKGGS